MLRDIQGAGAVRAYTRKVGYERMLKAIQADPASHTFLLNVVALAANQDPVDALKDLQVAMVLAEKRLDADWTVPA